MKIFHLKGVDIVLRHIAAVGPVVGQTKGDDAEDDVYDHSYFRIYLIGSVTIYPDIKFLNSELAEKAREALVKAVEDLNL